MLRKGRCHGRTGLILPDVNILISAFREDAFAHKETLTWLEDLVAKTGVTGNEIPDVRLAVLPIESGPEWVTRDQDFARYPNLNWRHLDPWWAVSASSGRRRTFGPLPGVTGTGTRGRRWGRSWSVNSGSSA